MTAVLVVVSESDSLHVNTLMHLEKNIKQVLGMGGWIIDTTMPWG